MKSMSATELSKLGSNPQATKKSSHSETAASVRGKREHKMYEYDVAIHMSQGKMEKIKSYRTIVFFSFIVGLSCMLYAQLWGA